MLSTCTFTLIAGTGLGLLIVSYVVAYIRSPLKDIPGPFLAKVTNVWRLIDHYKATQISTQRRLHEELGPAVRIGPNVVSLSDPTLLKTVYSTRGEFVKVRDPLTSVTEHTRARGRTSSPRIDRAYSNTPCRATSTQSMTLCKTDGSFRMSLALGATPSTAGI